MWKTQLVAVLRKKTALVAFTAVVSATAGAVTSYFVTEKKIEEKYKALSEKEIAQARMYAQAFYNKPTPEEMGAKYAEPDAVESEETMQKAMAALRKYTGEDGKLPTDHTVGGGVKIEYARPVNIFDRENDDLFNLEAEKSMRGTVEPYIITDEEYLENEPDHEQIQLTYYEDDNVLSDGGDSPVENRDVVIGEKHLERFGAGSNDPDIVYIRNPRLSTDMEVTKDPGSYAKIHHGIMRHSEDFRSVRKFRLNED